MRDGLDARAVALRSIAGFACNQGFIYYLLYLSVKRTLAAGGISLVHAGLFFALLFMVAAFALLMAAGARARSALLARPLLPGYAVLAVVASFVSFVLSAHTPQGVPALLAEGALIGVPSGFLLAAWGRILGLQPIEHSVPEVVLGSALAGAVCFLCAVFSPYALFVPMVLPLASAFLLTSMMARGEGSRDGAQRGEAARGSGAPHASSAALPDASRLSLKILAGTVAYGFVVGLTESFAGSQPAAPLASVAVTLFFLVMFCLAMYQTLNAERDDAPRAAAAGTQDGERGGEASKATLWNRVKLFAQQDGAASVAHEAQGPLDGAYRLAIMLIMSGFLFAPVLSHLDVSGESILLAGYLGLTVVLICLFLVMGRISGGDPALSFARGFAALFGGELMGLALGGVPALGGLAASAESAVAGVLALFAYLFLFTERDFRALSVAVADTDRFGSTCRYMVETFGLSPREADILPLALRGRTGERMASELFISKSTVETHLRRIYGKCGVRSRQELIDLGERLQGEGAGCAASGKGARS